MVIKAGESIVAKRERTARAKPIELGSTARVRNLNGMLLSAPITLCLHRARAYTEVFSQTEGQPTPLRFAKAFVKTLQDLPAVINEGELIVGAPACRIRAAGFNPEVQAAWVKREIDNLAHREASPFGVTAQQVEEVKEMLHYWEGKTVFDHWSRACPPEIATKVIGTGWADIAAMWHEHGKHFSPPFEIILNKGLYWYEGRIREALARVDYSCPENMDKEKFYQSLLLIIGAVKDFAGKYSKKAEELADHESDAKRKEELRRTSETLARVPYYGARSFHEALQAVCFMLAVQHIEGTGAAYVLGRTDQYLYPFYKADLEKGVLSREQAQELIECLYIKLTGTLRFLPLESSRRSPGYYQGQVVSLGGVDATGKDASNDLSYLFLEAAESVRTMQPDIALLCHPRETPYSLKLKGVELNALGMATPKFINTETIKTQLMEAGFSAQEAKLGWIRGCSEAWGAGCKQHGALAGSILNLPLALEAVLFNGRKRTPGQPWSGKLLGIETGDCRQFANFDQLLTAVKAQIAQEISDGHVATSWMLWATARHFPLLLQSLLTEACIERGLSVNAGGAEINIGPGFVISGGIGTLADSLAVIKKLVFEEKKISMEELLRAIDADFEGYETIRGMLINQAPKFGNDIDYVDDLAREIFRFVNAEARKYVTPLGNKNCASIVWPMSNVVQGGTTWATPDGRKARVQFSNHAGPTDGLDVNGPTANINSVTKLDHNEAFGVIHNLYLVNIDSEDKMNAVLNLIDLFFSRGGHHIQLNCQDKEVLIEAQKYPEQYRGLVVRVAGFFAYFVLLPKEIQNQIIGRTSHYV